eukprot:XP_001702043.1 predicted protein [Chlamydomonas reinhardtii]
MVNLAANMPLTRVAADPWAASHSVPQFSPLPVDTTSQHVPLTAERAEAVVRTHIERSRPSLDAGALLDEAALAEAAGLLLNPTAPNAMGRTYSTPGRPMGGRGGVSGVGQGLAVHARDAVSIFASDKNRIGGGFPGESRGARLARLAAEGAAPEVLHSLAAVIIQSYCRGWKARREVARIKSLRRGDAEAAAARASALAAAAALAREQERCRRQLRTAAKDCLLAVQAQQDYERTRARLAAARGLGAGAAAAPPPPPPSIPPALWSRCQELGLDPIQILLDGGMLSRQIEDIIAASQLAAQLPRRAADVAARMRVIPGDGSAAGTGAGNASAAGAGSGKQLLPLVAGSGAGGGSGIGGGAAGRAYNTAELVEQLLQQQALGALALPNGPSGGGPLGPGRKISMGPTGAPSLGRLSVPVNASSAVPQPFTAGSGVTGTRAQLAGPSGRQRRMSDLVAGSGAAAGAGLASQPSATALLPGLPQAPSGLAPDAAASGAQYSQHLPMRARSFVLGEHSSVSASGVPPPHPGAGGGAGGGLPLAPIRTGRVSQTGGASGSPANGPGTAIMAALLANMGAGTGGAATAGGSAGHHGPAHAPHLRPASGGLHSGAGPGGLPLPPSAMLQGHGLGTGLGSAANSPLAAVAAGGGAFARLTAQSSASSFGESSPGLPLRRRHSYASGSSLGPLSGQPGGSATTPGGPLPPLLMAHGSLGALHGTGGFTGSGVSSGVSSGTASPSLSSLNTTPGSWRGGCFCCPAIISFGQGGYMPLTAALLAAAGAGEEVPQGMMLTPQVSFTQVWAVGAKQLPLTTTPQLVLVQLLGQITDWTPGLRAAAHCPELLTALVRTLAATSDDRYRSLVLSTLTDWLNVCRAQAELIKAGMWWLLVVARVLLVPPEMGPAGAADAGASDAAPSASSGGKGGKSGAVRGIGGLLPQLRAALGQSARAAAGTRAGGHS